MSNDQTYNGWSNYETWLCKLWMDNDSGLYETQNEMAQEAMEDAENDKEDATHKLADSLESMWNGIAENSDLPESGFFADLTNRGLRAVNWYEIAENILSDITVYSAGWNIPGYMPDNEPARFTDKQDAIDYLKESLESHCETKDESYDPGSDPEYKAALEALNNGEDATYHPFVYWINTL